MFASKSTITKKAFDAIISFLRRKMQFRNRLSRPESHVRIEERNFEKVFWRQNLIFCVEKCNLDEGIRGNNRIFASKNVKFEGGCCGQNLIFALKNAISKKGFEARVALLRQRSRSWRRLLRVPCRVGSVGRSPIRFFDLIREPSASFITIIIVYGINGIEWKWENMLLGHHDTLRTMYHEKSFRLHKNSWRGHQRRWDEIAERRPLDLVAASTFPTLWKIQRDLKNKLKRITKILIK